MIPEFPEFKKLELSDRQAIEAHTSKYPPYSDFNFTSMWAWDTKGERMISELNGNLVVRFTDYSTNEIFLSFLGEQNTEETACNLLEFSKKSNLPLELRYVPEVSVRNIQSHILSIQEDRDNFDYVYSTSRLSTLQGNVYMSKRGSVHRFMRINPDARVEFIDLSNASTQSSIREVINVWELNKSNATKNYEIQHERDAIFRLCDTATSHNLVAVGLFVLDRMVGFSIEEILPRDHSICHFWKADTAYRGSFDFIMQKKVQHLESLNVEYLNYEQDLGIHALRTSKSSFRPVHFLKKYCVHFAQN